jgi:hypothetical protein
VCEKKRGVTDVIANSDKVGEWEMFQFTPIGKDEGNSSIWKGYFQSYNDSYMTINHMYCHFTANTKNRDQAAIFEVINMDT